MPQDEASVPYGAEGLMGGRASVPTAVEYGKYQDKGDSNKTQGVRVSWGCWGQSGDRDPGPEGVPAGPGPGTL